MDTDKKLQASKVINAPADKIFALLADPGQHTALDDSGMLRGPSEETPPISGIGQIFTMSMHNDLLGDYRMVNSVTAFVESARIGWSPKLDPTSENADKVADVEIGGHTWTYDLSEVEGGTQVTETYDWTSVKDPKFEEMFPLVTQEQIEASLDKLAAAVS